MAVVTGDEHYKQSEVMLVVAQMDDLPYEKAVIAANVAQTHALLAQIASARELGVIQQAGIDAFREATAAAAATSQRFCTRTPNCRMADGHADRCKP